MKRAKTLCHPFEVFRIFDALVRDGETLLFDCRERLAKGRRRAARRREYARLTPWLRADLGIHAQDPDLALPTRHPPWASDLRAPGADIGMGGLSGFAPIGAGDGRDPERHAPHRDTVAPYRRRHVGGWYHVQR